MKITKTTELDRLKMIYPSSAENLILKQCFLQRFLKGLYQSVQPVPVVEVVRAIGFFAPLTTPCHL